MRRNWIKGTLAVSALSLLPALAAPASAAIELVELGRYHTGIFDRSAAEITAYDAATQRLFVVNASERRIDVLSLADPSNPSFVGSIAADLPGYAEINSVAVHNGVVAFAAQSADKTQPGRVFLANAANATVQASVQVGALPDMLTFTPDGKKLLVANEGEPGEAKGSPNPEGSVSIIHLPTNAADVQQSDVKTAGFGAFEHLPRTSFSGTPDANAGSLKTDVRLFAASPTVAQDIEPEYITVSADGTKAYVALQENNALAVIDLATDTVTHLLPLGVKDHGQAGHGLDASDRDRGVNIRTYENLYGIYMPDAIATYNVDGRTYVVTANEGDSRADWADYEDEERFKHKTFNNLTAELAAYRDDALLGRLNVSTVDGKAATGQYTELYTFGARSFSIWDVTDPDNWDALAGPVFDSGDQFEQFFATFFPEYFNANHSEAAELDNRSDNKGPEPEGVTVAFINGRWYAFIGLERVGGVMTYDITDPLNPFHVDYINPRDFSIAYDEDLDDAATLALIGDLGPEGLLFIDAADSPTGQALLVVANEVSGTTTIYAIQDSAVSAVPEPASAMLGLMGLVAMGLAASRRRRTA